MARYAVFITDPVSVEEFVGLARIDTEADEEGDACERAARLYSEFSDVQFTVDDVALCALFPEADGAVPPFDGGAGADVLTAVASSVFIRSDPRPVAEGET